MAKRVSVQKHQRCQRFTGTGERRGTRPTCLVGGKRITIEGYDRKWPAKRAGKRRGK